MRRTRNAGGLRTVTGIGVFSALAFITTLICKLIPSVGGFLSLDAKDSVIAIASFIYGPVAAPIISVIVAFVEFVTISETGWYGLVMNIASSATFSLVASIIYKYRRSFNGAIIGFGAAVVATTSVMLLLNIFITPLYFGFPRSVVFDMLPTLILPFNFAKTLLNGAIALLLYKPIINALRAAGLVPKAKYKTTFNRSSALAIIIGGASLLVALIVLLIIW